MKDENTWQYLSILTYKVRVKIVNYEKILSLTQMIKLEFIRVIDTITRVTLVNIFIELN